MKEARTAADLSQAALAETAEIVTASEISKAERERSHEYLAKHYRWSEG